MECGTTVEMVPQETAHSAVQEMPAALAQDQTATPAASVPQPVPIPPTESAATAASVADATVAATPVVSSDQQQSQPPVTTAASQAGPRLVSSDGQVLTIKQEAEQVIGRDDPISGIHPDIDLTAAGGESGGVSRRHATLHFENGNWSVIDLDSTNYTRINGNRVAPNVSTPLHNGDKIQFGRLQFEFKQS
ncbi:MAG: hypothetical protein NVSMB42_22050 [Herpetosiphon sp.]